MTLDEAIEHCLEKAEEEKRKLLKVGDIYACSKCAEEHEQLAKWLKELKEYKELEEQNLLLKLPCKIGDTVYSVEVYEVEEFVVTHFDFCKDSIHAYHKYIYIGEMGHTVFATKEEAEQELERLENEQCKA